MDILYIEEDYQHTDETTDRQAAQCGPVHASNSVALSISQLCELLSGMYFPQQSPVQEGDSSM